MVGLKAVGLFGFVVFFSRGGFCVAPNWHNNVSSEETQNQIPQEPVKTDSVLRSPPQIPVQQSNQLEQTYPVHIPLSHRSRKPSVLPVNGDEQNLVRPSVRIKHRQLIQNPKRVEPRPTPQRTELRQTGQTPAPDEPQRPSQTQQLFEATIPDRSPDLNPSVKQQSKVLVKFQQGVPVPTDSVAVRCGEGEVTVEVKQNFLGNGQLITPSDLTVGGCAALDTTDHILLFQTALQDCGSSMTLTEEALIYAFSLIYAPTPIHNTFVIKTNPAEVVIECHYPRRQFVSSDAVVPTWKTYAADKLTEQQLQFSLRLMTEDWQSARPSSVYSVSDVMRIEASVLQAHHVPLRVYVDSCVATLDPDPNSQPRYPFVSNHGCLTDAKVSGAKSYFMQRTEEDKLQFQLKAFRFQQDDRASIYIICHLKATTVSVPINPEHKACSFLTEANRWVASGGDNQVCSCCDTRCIGQRRKRSLAADTGTVWERERRFRPDDDVEWEGEAVVGPILVQNEVLLEEVLQVSEFPPEQASLVQTHELTLAATPASTALLCGVGAALGVVLLLFMGAAIHRRSHKQTGHPVCT